MKLRIVNTRTNKASKPIDYVKEIQFGKSFKLVNYPVKVLWRGTTFRCPGKYPFEDIVDLMIIDTITEFSIYSITGYHAGQMLCVLPKEALSPNNNIRAISKEWVIKNWDKWIYSDCAVEDVYIYKPIDPQSLKP
ncbi:Imm45 family immunity protein [Fusobacterium varium]|uniref:Imm45 family immunity protein n=1 Tax=Fusobacterium varium TaxID=856 RepID=UPI002430FB9A|nr:Imm45 family immunity protein [Fusobacterium varium]